VNKSTNLPELARFGTFELTVRTGELVSIGTAALEAGSAKVLLREQPFQILRILVERQGNIVTRQEIRQILWPDDTIMEFDRSINVAMAILRTARIPADRASRMATEFDSRSGLTRTASRYATPDRRPN
jgi:DNA-binding response OmpR family regulator